jgi:hypothetical protein
VTISIEVPAASGFLDR